MQVSSMDRRRIQPLGIITEERLSKHIVHSKPQKVQNEALSIALQSQSYLSGIKALLYLFIYVFPHLKKI